MKVRVSIRHHKAISTVLVIIRITRAYMIAQVMYHKRKVKSSVRLAYKLNLRENGLSRTNCYSKLIN